MTVGHSPPPAGTIACQAAEAARVEERAVAGGAMQQRAAGEQRLASAVKTLKVDSKRHAADAAKMKQVRARMESSPS